MKKLKISLLAIAVMTVCAGYSAKKAQPLYKFDFGSGKAKSGYTQVGNAAFSAETGYGVDLGTTAESAAREKGGKLDSDMLRGDAPFYFSVAMPEGNYKITVTLGDADRATETLIKAESRRLMVEAVKTLPGEFVTKEFVVNVRTPKINAENSIRLNTREYGKLDWDEKLTIEFNGAAPSVTSMTIEKAEPVITLFLTGDSTVVDQDSEPWNSWGQMLTNFFDTGVSVANYAESGQSARSSISSRRLSKVASQIKKGDYLFMQFGHNDMKARGEGVGAFTSYTEELKQFIKVARDAGATPVLVTSMHRRNFDEDGKVVNTLKDYPDAVRRLAVAENLPLIDLNTFSAVLYEALGAIDSAVAFQDGTHHNNYGSYELAKCVVEGIIANIPALAEHVSKYYVRFNPGQPDNPDTFYMPASPRFSLEKPLGD